MGGARRRRRLSTRGNQTGECEDARHHLKRYQGFTPPFHNDTTNGHTEGEPGVAGSRQLQPCVANALATILADVFNAKLIVNAAGSDPNSRHVDCS
jgi:hypothetical protein